MLQPGQPMAPAALTVIGKLPVNAPPFVVVAQPGQRIAPAALKVIGRLALNAPPFVVVAQPGQETWPAAFSDNGDAAATTAVPFPVGQAIA